MNMYGYNPFTNITKTKTKTKIHVVFRKWKEKFLKKSEEEKRRTEITVPGGRRTYVGRHTLHDCNVVMTEHNTGSLQADVS